MLMLIKPSNIAVLRGDGAEYQVYASNLLQHGVFSAALHVPYYPSVVRSPGYPLFLAAIESVAGSRPIAVQAIQFAVLAALAILVGFAGRATTNPMAGTFAGVMAVTYIPLIWFTPRYLTEILASFLVAVMVILMLLARRSDRLVMYAGSGFALAALSYVRPEFLLMVVPIALILVLNRRGSWRSRSRWGACLAFTGAVAIAIAPWMIRNTSVTGGRVLPMAASSGSDLFASADQYEGLITYKFTLNDWHRYSAQIAAIAPTPVQDLNARGQVRVDDRLRSAAVRAFESLSVGQIVRSLPKRLAYLWGTADSQLVGKSSNLAHRLAQLQYALVVLLGVLGVLIRRRRLLDDWPLWISAAYLTLIHLVAHVEIRYTLPARPMLMIYSAVGIYAFPGLLRRQASSRSVRASVRTR